MAITDGPISNTTRFGNRPDTQARAGLESNNEPQEYVSIAEYLRGIQQRNLLALDRLGQLLKSVTGAGPEPYEPEKPNNMTEHVKRILDEADEIEEQISRLAYVLGINV